MLKIFQIDARKLSMSESAITPETQVQQWVCEYVSRNRHKGAARAIHEAATWFSLTQSRVVEIMRGRVKKVWASEYLRAQACHAKFLAQTAAVLEHEAEMYRIRYARVAEKHDT